MRTASSSYSFSVQLASNFKLPSERIHGEWAALVPVHNGVADVVVGGSVQILGHHLRVKGNTTRISKQPV